MKYLIKLFLMKKKTKIRNLFSKPVSAIMTCLMIVGICGMFVPVFSSKGKEPLTDSVYMVFVMSIIFLNIITILISVLQKRRALFFEEDSYYMFVGPFSYKQILIYTLFDGFFQCLLIGFMTGIFPILIVGVISSLPFIYVLFSILVSILLVYTMIIAFQYLYIRSMVSETNSKIKNIVIILFLIMIIGILAYYFITTGYHPQETFLSFAMSNEFHYVPLIGWAKYAMVSVYENNIMGVCISLGLIILVDVIIAMMTVRIKGDFYERAMIDATEFSEYYKKALAGEVDTKATSLKNATITFQKKERALFSKNKLILLKSRTLFSNQDIFSLVLVIGMAAFSENFPIYIFLVLFYLMNSISSSSLIEDLKSNYIYLIPGTPIKKMFYILLIPILKTLILSTLMLLGGYFFVEIKTLYFIVSGVLIWSFVIVFYAGCISSLRLLKSRSNKMTEAFVRILVMALAIVPSIFIGWIAYQFISDINTLITIVAPTLVAFNFLIGIGILILCAPMLNGHDYTAE